MNVFFLILLIPYTVAVFMYYFWDKVSKKTHYDASVVLAGKEEDCVLVPIYATKYIFWGRIGTNISIDDKLAANVKPGESVLVPIKPGVRNISVYWYEKAEKYDVEINIDEDTMLYTRVEWEGALARPFIKKLKKDDSIDESLIEKDFQRRLGEIKASKAYVTFGLLIWGIPALIVAAYLF
jgi:hypothetical protein